jgi:hypothetical protein
MEPASESLPVLRNSHQKLATRTFGKISLYQFNFSFEFYLIFYHFINLFLNSKTKQMVIKNYLNYEKLSVHTDTFDSAIIYFNAVNIHLFQKRKEN